MGCISKIQAKSDAISEIWQVLPKKLSWLNAHNLSLIFHKGPSLRTWLRRWVVQSTHRAWQTRRTYYCIPCSSSPVPYGLVQRPSVPAPPAVAASPLSIVDCVAVEQGMGNRLGVDRMASWPLAGAEVPEA